MLFSERCALDRVPVTVKDRQPVAFAPLLPRPLPTTRADDTHLPHRRT